MNPAGCRLQHACRVRSPTGRAQWGAHAAGVQVWAARQNARDSDSTLVQPGRGVNRMPVGNESGGPPASARVPRALPDRKSQWGAHAAGVQVWAARQNLVTLTLLRFNPGARRIECQLEMNPAGRRL